MYTCTGITDAGYTLIGMVHADGERLRCTFVISFMHFVVTLFSAHFDEAVCSGVSQR